MLEFSQALEYEAQASYPAGSDRGALDLSFGKVAAALSLESIE